MNYCKVALLIFFLVNTKQSTAQEMGNYFVISVTQRIETDVCAVGELKTAQKTIPKKDYWKERERLQKEFDNEHKKGYRSNNLQVFPEGTAVIYYKATRPYTGAYNCTSTYYAFVTGKDFIEAEKNLEARKKVDEKDKISYSDVRRWPAAATIDK